MNHETSYLSKIELDEGPLDIIEHPVLQTKMGFSYLTAIGKLHFAAITCRPDILHAVIKLSQYNNRPHEIHYSAVKRVFCVLPHTLQDGLQFWRPCSDTTLPDTALLSCLKTTIPSFFRKVLTNMLMVQWILVGQLTNDTDGLSVELLSFLQEHLSSFVHVFNPQFHTVLLRANLFLPRMQAN